MHPLSKVVLMFYLLTLTAFYYNLFYLIPVVVVTLTIAWITKIPMRWIKVRLRLLSVTWIWGIIGGIFNSHALWMVDPDYYKVLPPSFTQNIIFVLTPEGFPLYGYTALTYGSLYLLIVRLVKLPAFMVAGYTLIYSLNLSDVISMLNKAKVPSTVVLIVQVAWRYLSLTVDMMARVWNAQTLRGFEIKTKNPMRLFRATIPFLIPLGRNFVVMVDQVGLSVGNRAFGSQEVFNPYRKINRSWFDNFCIFVLPVLLVIQFYLCTTAPWYFGNI